MPESASEAELSCELDAVISLLELRRLLADEPAATGLRELRLFAGAVEHLVRGAPTIARRSSLPLSTAIEGRLLEGVVTRSEPEALHTAVDGAWVALERTAP